MFDFFALLIAIVALIVARKTFNQIAVLRARLDAFEGAAVQGRPAAAPPPLAPYQPPPLPEIEPVVPIAESPDTAPEHDVGGAAPTPQPAATPSFEERVG